MAPVVGLAATCCSSGGAVGSTISAALQFFAAAQCLVQEPWPQHANINNGSTYDFIIVGGGTAGSTLAARLAETKNFTVLLIEAGMDPPQESIVPAFHSALLASPYDWNFTTIDDGNAGQALAKGIQRQPRGKMLGGSGSINNMIYARGFPADYDDWVAVAGPDWSWANVLPYFKKTEHMTDQQIVDNEDLMKYHGRDGEIEVSGLKQTSEEIKRFLEVFKEIGFEMVDDMTNPHKIGAGKFSHTVRDGRRDSSLTALLNKANGENLFVMKNALVAQILFKNATAVGVKVLTGDDELNIYVTKEVIVSAGTFNTPKLLMLSGIGPKDHLHKLGIDVVKDLPVGSNLHDHTMFLNYIAAQTGTCSTDEASQYMDMIKYLYNRSGSLANADSMGALFALNGSDPNTPDFAFYPTCNPQKTQFYSGCVSVIGLNSEICKQLDAVNQDNELISIAVVLLKPKSRGKVLLRSTYPLHYPLIHSGTFNNPEDLDGFPEAVRIINSLAETEYFKKKSAYVVDIKIGICDGLNMTEKIKCKAKAMATSAWHAVGTAAMGKVVDGQLRVFGVKGLRVVDASVMSSVTRGNTNAPVVMIAEKAADFIMTAYGAEYL